MISSSGVHRAKHRGAQRWVARSLARAREHGERFFATADSANTLRARPEKQRRRALRRVGSVPDGFGADSADVRTSRACARYNARVGIISPKSASRARARRSHRHAAARSRGGSAPVRSGPGRGPRPSLANAAFARVPRVQRRPRASAARSEQRRRVPIPDSVVFLRRRPSAHQPLRDIPRQSGVRHRDLTAVGSPTRTRRERVRQRDTPPPSRAGRRDPPPPRL